MKARIVPIVAAALVALGAAVGCQRGRSDAQVASDVQSRINSDQAVQSRQYTVTANQGVVTLNGSVNSDSERAAAASDAAQAAGVKTVVNNLQVAPPAVAQQPVPPQETPPAPPAEPAKTHRGMHHKPSGIVSAEQPAAGENAGSQMPAAGMMAENAPPAPIPPPPQPVDVTVPNGTTLSIRLIDAVDSGHNQPGDRFRATLDSPLRLGDTVVIPAGADISGRVASVTSAGHYSQAAELALELTRLSVNGKSYELHTDQYSREGTARSKNTAEKVGGGAVLGAIIGGLAGGGKGAAIGAGVGAGAGTATQAATHGKEVHLTSEQVLTFHLTSPLTVTPAGNPNGERQRLSPPQ